MWLVTKIGFFSIVEKPEDQEAGMVTVRARVLSDIESLMSLLPGAGPIVKSTKAERRDYRYRVRVSKTQLSQAMTHLIHDIDYNNIKRNFKHQDEKELEGELKHKEIESRSEIYFRVWDDLAFLEYLDDLKTGKN